GAEPARGGRQGTVLGQNASVEECAHQGGSSRVPHSSVKRSYHPAMTRISPLVIDRFKRLPRRTHDLWQGGLVRARTWVEDDDGEVRRPWAAVWVSSATGMINVQLAETDPPDADLALQTLVDLGLKFAHSRPSGLEMKDGALGAELIAA